MPPHMLCMLPVILSLGHVDHPMSNICLTLIELQIIATIGHQGVCVNHDATTYGSPQPSCPTDALKLPLESGSRISLLTIR